MCEDDDLGDEFESCSTCFLNDQSPFCEVGKLARCRHHMLSRFPSIHVAPPRVSTCFVIIQLTRPCRPFSLISSNQSKSPYLKVIKLYNISAIQGSWFKQLVIVSLIGDPPITSSLYFSSCPTPTTDLLNHAGRIQGRATHLRLVSPIHLPSTHHTSSTSSNSTLTHPRSHHSCASSPGNHPVYEAAARSVGRAIAESGRKLVYGGGVRGMMGESSVSPVLALSLLPSDIFLFSRLFLFLLFAVLSIPTALLFSCLSPPLLILFSPSRRLSLLPIPFPLIPPVQSLVTPFVPIKLTPSQCPSTQTGFVSDAALQAGGSVHGIIPSALTGRAAERAVKDLRDGQPGDSSSSSVVETNAQEEEQEGESKEGTGGKVGEDRRGGMDGKFINEIVTTMHEVSSPRSTPMSIFLAPIKRLTPDVAPPYPHSVNNEWRISLKEASSSSLEDLGHLRRSWR